MRETVPRSVTGGAHFPAWFREFLHDELSPYPGRLTLAARMVVAATVVMLLHMTFRIPYAEYAALYALNISREDLRATLKAAKTNIIAFALSAAFVLFGAMLFAGDPLLRFLWVVGALFTLFFCLSAMTNYTAAARFGWMVVVIIPVWDQHITAEAKVESTLWIIGALTLATLIAAAVELIFKAASPSSDLLRSIAERLTTVEELLRCYADGCAVDESKANRLTRLTMLGTSRLRRLLQHSAVSMGYGERMGAVVALVGRVVDLAASLIQLNPQFSMDDRERIRTLTENLAMIRSRLQAEQAPEPLRATDALRANIVPLLSELEETVRLIPEAFTGAQSLSAYAPRPPGHAPPARLLVPDAFTDPKHIRFALKGCLAASLCYVIYMALDWPGISTAVITCFLTALSTIGSSHQKQVLRIAGAIAGGALGLLAQIFILPSVDSITGFLLLFLVITFVGAWLMTSGPRLSYFGVQLAYAFYIINLSDFKIQTSLTEGRDRVVGILLGLAAMWLVFDQLWGAPAGIAMKEAFISTLRALAKMAREPLSRDPPIAIEQSYALREKVNAGFNNVRALADGALFEFGASRPQDLALRSRILGWQPQLRMLFVGCVALLKYRLQLPGFELPEPVGLARQELEECLARTVNEMADRLLGQAPEETHGLETALARVRSSVQNAGSMEDQSALTAHLTTFLSLSERITKLAVSLAKL